MITEQRHQLILQLIKEREIVKISELVEATNTSESTIRRDLNILEEENYIKRLHGGATLVKNKVEELSYKEKASKSTEQKRKIGEYAASLVKDGECIYLDAGTTTFEMIRYLEGKNITVVTNGLYNINALSEIGVSFYIIGGKVKNTTKAVVGVAALRSLENYRFDKCFIGTNGIHQNLGFTTPDSEEAILKSTAMSISRKAYVLADNSKFGEVSFVKISDLDKAEIITDEIENIDKYKEKTNIKVVI